MKLFHYHLVTSRVREVEARYLGKLAFGLVARHGRIGEEYQSFEPGMSWEELDRIGFKLRLTELERGSVNVVVQPGQWDLPRVDHLGLALDEDEFADVVDRAVEQELRVQAHGGRRTFIATNAGYRLEVHPPREWLDELLEASDVLQLTELQLLADDPGGEGGRARRAARHRAGRHERHGRRLGRQLHPRRPAGTPAAARRAAHLTPDPPRRVRAVSDDRTYAAAGVSLATAEGIVERLRAAVESTGARGFGAFAGLHPLDERRLLAASTDSIGTKPIVARRRGALRACGADMAAHCINDVITCGADPLILLDYVAANRIDLEQVADLVEGAAEVCRAAGVALIGGETAELPGVYREDELDFAATCVGIVERDRVIDGSAVEAGDYVDRAPVRGRARERVHARPLGARGRGLRRPRPARADAALPRRRPAAARRERTHSRT